MWPQGVKGEPRQLRNHAFQRQSSNGSPDCKSRARRENCNIPPNYLWMSTILAWRCASSRKLRRIATVAPCGAAISQEKEPIVELCITSERIIACMLSDRHDF